MYDCSLFFLRKLFKITVDGGIKTEVQSKINDVGEVLGGMKKIFCCRAVGMNVKRILYERVILHTVFYGAGKREYDSFREEKIECNRDQASEEYVWSNMCTK